MPILIAHIGCVNTFYATLIFLSGYTKRTNRLASCSDKEKIVKDTSGTSTFHVVSSRSLNY
jgi:hypothetical protein